MTGSDGTRYINTECKADAPISWSTQDTDETIRQVKRHNAIYKELCP